MPNGEIPVREVQVRLVRPDEVRRWNALMRAHHYLGFRKICGRWLPRRRPALRRPRPLDQPAAAHLLVPDCEQHPLQTGAKVVSRIFRLTR